MAYLLYKYLRRKHQERQAARDGVPVSEQSQITPAQTQVAQPKPTTSRAAIIQTVVLLVGLALPVFLETLDYTIVATAQSHIASIFNSLNMQSYIGTVYLLTSTVFLPLFASFADIFGRHWTLQLALLFFMVGSAISTGAHNMATMLAGRGIAGVGAAGLLASVRIILADSRSLDANNWQQSAMFLLYTIGFCLGPFIGGALLNVSFRWVFAINLPCCAAGMIIAFLLLRTRTKGAKVHHLPHISTEEEGEKEPLLRGLMRVDWIGALSFMGAGILVLLALNWGSTEKWSETKVIVCWVIGGVLFIGFLVWEYFLENVVDTAANKSKLFVEPMIPVSLFKSVDVCAVQYALFVTGLIMLVMFYFVAIFSVIVNGESANKAGAQLIYFAPGMGGGSFISIYMIKIIRQPKYPAIIGGVLETVALGLISSAMERNNQGQVNGFMAMAGVGVGMSIGPLAVHARFSQPEHLVAIVAGLTLFFRSFGGTIGLAQCGAVLNAKVNTYIANAIRTGVLSGDDAIALSAATASTDLSSLQSISNLPPEVQQVIRAAFQNGLKWSFLSLVPWTALAPISCLFLSHIQDRSDLDSGRSAEVRDNDYSLTTTADNSPNPDAPKTEPVEKASRH